MDMTEKQEKTIPYRLLTAHAKKVMQERYALLDERVWYAEPHGRGFKMHGIQNRLMDLFYAQGGPDETWYRVVDDEHGEAPPPEDG